MGRERETLASSKRARPQILQWPYFQPHREEQEPPNTYVRSGSEDYCKIIRQRRMNQKGKKKVKPNENPPIENEPANKNSKIHT